MSDRPATPGGVVVKVSVTIAVQNLTCTPSGRPAPERDRMLANFHVDTATMSIWTDDVRMDGEKPLQVSTRDEPVV
jgi:hypothetical protein